MVLSGQYWAARWRNTEQWSSLQGVSYDALKKKDDDRTKETRYVTANVKLEVELLTRRDADELPVGRKRLEPNRVNFFCLDLVSSSDDELVLSKVALDQKNVGSDTNPVGVAKRCKWTVLMSEEPEAAFFRQGGNTRGRKWWRR